MMDRPTYVIRPEKLEDRRVGIREVLSVSTARSEENRQREVGSLLAAATDAGVDDEQERLDGSSTAPARYSR